jgi:dienelactone hydrolase
VLRAYLVAALWFIAFPVSAQVFDVAHQGEISTRTLLVPVAKTRAVVLLFPGGGGRASISDEGTVKSRHTFIRSLNLWSQYHIDAVLVDTPYDLGDLRRGNLRERQDHMDRVGEVVSYYKNKTRLPIWVFGHSMGTSTATYFANQSSDQSKQLAGIIIAGTIRTASLSDTVTLPVLGIHHPEDACLGTPVSATKRIIEGRPAKFISKLEMIEGGVSEGNVCESFAYHGFNQTEPELIKRAAQFILSQ